MNSPWIDLLFLHGHIQDPALARRLACPDELAPGPGRKASADPAPAPPAPPRPAAGRRFRVFRGGTASG